MRERRDDGTRRPSRGPRWPPRPSCSSRDHDRVPLAADVQILHLARDEEGRAEDPRLLVCALRELRPAQAAREARGSSGSGCSTRPGRRRCRARRRVSSALPTTHRRRQRARPGLRPRSRRRTHRSRPAPFASVCRAGQEPRPRDRPARSRPRGRRPERPRLPACTRAETPFPPRSRACGTRAARPHVQAGFEARNPAVSAGPRRR